jgi:hypothetical protein
MKIEISNFGVKLTNVPDEVELSKDKVYYVYEWFIKDSQKVFYIGKGKGDRYKQDKNSLFIKIKENFDCDVRFVKENLTEYEALTLEEELFAKREQEGHVLTNIVTPNALGAFEKPEELTYMQTPRIRVSRVDREYFGLEDVSFDEISLESLMKTHIKKTTTYGTGKLFIQSDEDFIPQEVTNKLMDELSSDVTRYVESKGGRVYKSQAKAVKSLIFYNTLPYESYVDYKEKGYEVYHLVDVLKYIEQNK